MSRFEAPPGIITNGLVLNLDAGDPDSYTRSQPPYVEVLVVAGGGGGSGNFYDDGAGGGAGGLIYNSAYQLLSAAAITVTIGAGGAASTGGQGGDGGNSVFGSLTAIGGGGGAAHRSSGRAGGSGGGSAGAYDVPDTTIGGAGTPGQGFDGGTSVYPGYAGSGGGGAGQPGVGGTGGGAGKNGGNGQAYSISGTSTYYAGGGAGYGYTYGGIGGLGGGGNGGNPSPLAPIAGGTNTGGGGGGGRTAGQTPFVGTVPGGSGIVIVRYPGLPAATGGTIAYLNGYTIHTFTTSGTFTPFLWNDTINGRNVTLVNGPIFNPIVKGGYIAFDGTDDYGILNPLSIPTGNQISISFWNYGIDARVSSIIASSFNSSDQTLNIHLPWSNNRVYWDCGNPSNRIEKDATNAEYQGWHHWVFTKNASTGNMYIYLDGTQWHSGGGLTSTIPSMDIAKIGSYWNGTISHNGYIAQCLIYNREVSASEITQNYNAGRARFGL
jgi:hypothetical protein